MSQGLNSLAPRKGATSSRKRVGRGPGSGLGKTAGRGHKGQQSRSGYHRRIGNEGGQMPLHRRVPKRGFTNIFRQEFNVLTVENLERAFEAGTAVNEAALKSAGFKLKTGLPVKILGTGDLKKALTVSAHNFTAGARKKIEAAGGRCEEVQA